MNPNQFAFALETLCILNFMKLYQIQFLLAITLVICFGIDF